MQPFVIYFRAIAFYAAVTIPALALPIMYMISLLYVLFYGWFACALFVIIYHLVIKLKFDFETSMAFLYIGVVLSVLFAFQMLEITEAEEDIWNSGPYLLFPLAAVIAGWISVTVARNHVRDICTAFKHQPLNSSDI